MISFQETIKDKKILFIGAKFYHYNEEIMNKLKIFGAEVTFFYERDISLKYGLAKTISSNYANKIQDNHYRNILKRIDHLHFDYLFVIRGYKMEEWFVKAVKKKFPRIKTILYQWDSIYNWECDYRHMIPWFDVTKTFDYKDAAQLNLEYVPTFHTDDFKKISTDQTVYDLFFFGGYSYTRYEFVTRLKEYADAHQLKLKIYLAISYKYYLKERVSGKKLDAKLLSFSQLNQKQYYKMFSQANIIMDYTNPAQTGITMRSLDALGAGKKLLTSNEYITREPGYNKEQIRIFNPANIHIDPEFLIPESFPHQDYSIEKWLEAIFN